MEYLVVVNDLDKNRIIKKTSEKEGIIPCKIIGYREFIKKFYFDYSKETIYDLVKNKNITIEIAEMYLKNFYYLREEKSKNEKIQFLQNLKSELEKKELLIPNPLWKEKLKKQKIIFYHLAKNDQFFQELQAECKKITTTQTIELETNPNQSITIQEYSDIDDEVIGICNHICDLLKNGWNSQKIYITNLSSAYRKKIQTWGDIFHLKFALKEEDSFISTQIVTDFLNHYDEGIEQIWETLQAKYTQPEEIEILNQIVEICNRYSFITDEKEKKIFIISDLKKPKKEKNLDTTAIKEINILEQEIEPDTILFLVGANEGIFPKIKKDEEYFSDIEWQELRWNTTEEQNEIEKEYCVQKIKTIPNIQISHPKQDGKLELYPSSILEKFPNDHQKEKQPRYNNSHLYNQLNLGKKLDQFQKYGTKDSLLDILLGNYQDIPYNQYQNQFTTFQIERNEPLKLSYSSLDSYFHCAFRYYLTHILHLNKYEKSFDQKIGTLFHEILKESYEPNFDFETSWQKQKQEFEFSTPQEKFFFKKLKKDLKRVLDTLKMQENGKEFEIQTEKKVNIPVNNKAEITGIFDKIFLGKRIDKTLISIVDYKTGNPNLTIDYLPYGINLQLPIYLYLLKKLPYQNIKVVGFYLQKILPSLPERDHIHTEEELKQKKLKLQGYSIDEESILSEFDPTFEDSKLIASLKKSSKGFYAYSKILSEEQLKKIEQIVEEKIKEATSLIHSNQFEINPKRIGNKLVGCDYCSFQDICYRKEENIQNLKEIKASDFLGGEKNANMDQRTE